MVFRHRLLIGSKRNHSPTSKQGSWCSLKLAGSLARAQGGLTHAVSLSELGWSSSLSGLAGLKGPRYSFQVLSQLSDKKQTEKAALTVSPRAKAHTAHKRRWNSGVGPKTKVQAGSRRCRPPSQALVFPWAHFFQLQPLLQACGHCLAVPGLLADPS